ncbi:MAG: homocysteine S-methyltransferase family protein [Ignavibacteriales bacterium]
MSVVDTLGKEVLVFDGATGTMLQALGLPAGHCPDAWCLERPDLVASVHKRYGEAGAQIVETNTFGATPVRLSRYGLQDRAGDINVAAVRIAREAMEGRTLVAGSMGPLGVLVDPLGDFSFDAAYNEFATQARAFREARPDFIIIETVGDLNEMRAAILACKDHAPGVRIIAQMTMSANGRTFTGTDPETAGLVLQSLGADIIGFNCSVGPETLVSAVERIHRVARVPVSVQPNAGMPVLQPDGKTAFPMGPEEFASYGPGLVAAGASIVGGCCGTTPEHIRCLRRAVEGLRPGREVGPLGRAFGLASRTGSLFINPGQPAAPVFIGGRIDPSRRDDIAADMREGGFSLVKKEAKEQVTAGAQVIAVSSSGPGLDEAAAMERAVRTVQRTVRVPVCLRSSSAAALEAGLKAFVGKALVGPFTLEKRTAESVLPVARRYGAAVIGLTIDEKGAPSPSRRLLETARRLVDTAAQHGIPSWDVVIEPAITSEESVNELGMIERELGCLTCRGVFAGLDMAVITPETAT